jgi:hypothetical protein
MGEFKLVPLFVRKSSAELVRGDLVERMKTSSEPEMAHQRASE